MSYDQARGMWLDIMPQPFAKTGDILVAVECKTNEDIRVRVYNACPGPAILGVPEAPGWVAIEPWNERTFYLKKDNPTATLTPLSGELLCAYSEVTALEYCDYDMLNLRLVDQDVVQITCPKDLPPSVDTTGKAIYLLVETSSTTINLALQVGCQMGGPCYPIYAFGGGSQSFSTPYPVTSPSTKMCVKAFGAVLPSQMYYAKWSVQFSGGPTTTFSQANAQWLGINVPSDARSIYLYGSAVYEPSQPAPEPTQNPQPATDLSLSATNYCDTDALIGSPRESDLFIFPANSGLGFGTDFVYSEDPREIFTSLTGREMCFR